MSSRSFREKAPYVNRTVWVHTFTLERMNGLFRLNFGEVTPLQRIISLISIEKALIKRDFKKFINFGVKLIRTRNYKNKANYFLTQTFFHSKV